MIIGLTGSYAAGKDAAAKYLVRKGFFYHSYSDILRGELVKLGKPTDRENLIWMGNKVRREFGAGELSKRILAEIKKNQEEKALAVGMRNPAEVEFFRAEKSFQLWFLQAPIQLRYERAQKRKRPEDEVSFDEFKKQETQEHSSDPNEQQLGRVATMADATIVNGEDLASLYKKIDGLLEKI